MQKRLSVMLQAVRTVRPAMEAFYQTLSDEQKARFNAISPEEAAQSNERDLSQACNARTAGISSLPIDRIEQTVRPNEVQRVALKGLRDAMSESFNLLTVGVPDLSGADAGRPGRSDGAASRRDVARGADAAAGADGSMAR